MSARVTGADVHVGQQRAAWPGRVVCAAWCVIAHNVRWVLIRSLPAGLAGAWPQVTLTGKLADLLGSSCDTAEGIMGKCCLAGLWGLT